MAIDSNQWTTVGTKKKTHRSNSPPLIHGGGAVPTENVQLNSISVAGHPGSTTASDPHGNVTFASTSGSVSFYNDDDSTTVPTEKGKIKDTILFSDRSTTSDTTTTAGKQSALQPDLNVPTNDGTYRLTFRWKPKGPFSEYHEQSPLWLTEVYSMLCDLFPDEDCYFYRWESRDLKMSTSISTLSPGELREFLSPIVTFLPSTSQIIFGARVCFASKLPGKWRAKEYTNKTLLDHQVQVSISNSTTTSGRIVTAGYILFKAARTTHRHRYLQSLRQQLPAETPFFDILLFHKTPMEQKINHLVIQCGENHVSPLSQALSEVLTGRNSPLYLSRIALAKLQPSQISAYFEMQDIYAKSLKSFPFFPTLINLDKVRKEIYDDGTVIERSTREWASSVFKDTDDIEARCEVVNGGFDQKAYLLTPFKYSTFVSEQFRQYRLRINPIGRREARFRDSLPGLPSVIHIDTSTQRNLDLLETMLSKEMWQRHHRQ
ncbi:hypothetical protein MHU86_6267 [Fragilaria crotonensis]|nr:hypothetical protein MHU86_6267 [Fragilaria crotonensis]